MNENSKQNMFENEELSEKICEACKKPFKRLLSHIAAKKSCRKWYGPKFEEMKRQKIEEKEHS